MSQYNSSMFSDAVYLFGTTFASAPSWGNSEELPDGTKVNQKELAEQAVLAAFAYLYNKKLIDIVLVERKSLFNYKMMVIVKKLHLSPLEYLEAAISGLEAAIFAYVLDNVGIGDIIQELLSDQSGSSFSWSWQVGHKPLRNVSNPWGAVLQIVKKNLLERGILKQVEKVEKGKVLFRTTYKYVMNGDISKEEKQVTELKKTLKELQSKGELYQLILWDIEQGIASTKAHGYPY